MGLSQVKNFKDLYKYSVSWRPFSYRLGVGGLVTPEHNFSLTIPICAKYVQMGLVFKLVILFKGFAEHFTCNYRF